MSNQKKDFSIKETILAAVEATIQEKYEFLKELASKMTEEEKAYFFEVVNILVSTINTKK